MGKTDIPFLRRFKIFFVKKVLIEKLIIIVLINPTVSTFLIEKIILIVVCTIVLTSFLVQSCLEKVPLLKNPKVVFFLKDKIIKIVIFIIKDFLMLHLVGSILRYFKDATSKNTIVHFRHLYSLIKIGLLVTVLFLGLIDFFNITEVLRVFFYTTKDSLVGKYIVKLLQFVICFIKVFIIMNTLVTPNFRIVRLDSLNNFFFITTLPVLALIEFFKLAEVPPDLPSDSFVFKYIFQHRDPESLFRMAMYLVWMIRDMRMLIWGRKYLWNNTPIDPEDLVPAFVFTCLILNFPLVWILYSIADPAK